MSAERNIGLIQSMRTFDIDLRAISAVRPLFELRKRYANEYLHATDEEKRKEALRGIDYCNTEICTALLIATNED